MNLLARIADCALNRPLLITREKAAVIMQVLGGRIGIDASSLAPDASRFVGDASERDATGNRVSSLPYRRTPEGVAIISIVGSLVNRGAYIGASSGLVSYEGIQFQLSQAAADTKVRAVLLDISSPGGEAIGAFETAEAVRRLAGVKPVTAVVNGMAASAAYAIASAAREIVTIDTGVVGSIGVVLLHADFSEQLQQDGVKPTLIFAGAHKVDGNPFEALPESVRADMQAEVNAFYDKFVATVAKGRSGRMTAAQIRATEARTFIGSVAVEKGLADRVGTFETALADLTRALGRSPSHKGASMSENNGASAAENAGIPKAEHEAAVKAARAEGASAGKAEAVARVAAILSSKEAAGREAQARTIALETDMTAEQAEKVLAASPKVQGLSARMEANPVPNIGAADGGEKPKASLDPSAIYSARRAAAK